MIIHTWIDLVAALEAHQESKTWTSMTTTISCLGADTILKVSTPCIIMSCVHSCARLTSFFVVVAVLGNEGFTYHNRVPPISSVMINPVQDSDLSVELSLVASNLNLCPSIVVLQLCTITELQIIS